MRLFVSIDPPAELAQSLGRTAALADWPKARLTPADHIHLTAHFIGETPPRALDDTLESIARSAAGLRPFTLTLTRLALLPEDAPPRLIAALADPHPTLLELHRRLVHRLARRPNPSRKPADDFLPHFTLARFPVTPSPDTPLPLPPLTNLSFRTECIAVKASLLKPTGAEHQVIRLISLA